MTVAILKDATEKIVAKLAGAITTTNPLWSLIWNGDGGPANPIGSFDGTTEVTLLTGVNGKPIMIESVQIYNADSDNVTATIYKKVGDTLYPFDKATLSTGTNHFWSASPSGPQGEEGATGPEAELGYLSYVAILTQAGTGDPVATVLKNTLGGALVWARDDIGQYTGTLADAFTLGKTWITFNNLFWDGNGNNTLTRNNANSVTLLIAAGDDFLDAASFPAMIEIRVYP